MRNPFSGRSRVGEDICATFLLAVVTLGVFWPWLFAGRAFYWGDIGLYFAPFTSFLDDNLHKGIIPLWNPELLCGAPYLGNPQVWPFSPITILLPFLEPNRYLMVMDTASIFLAGLFCYRYLTRGILRLRWIGGLLGALIFMLGGFVVSKSQFPNMLAALAYMPLCLLQTERLVRDPSAKQSAWLGVAFGLQILAAHAQITLMTVYLCLFVALNAGSWWRRSWKKLFVRLAWFAVAGAFAAGLSCVEWLPVIALWHSAGRHVLGLDVANRFYLGVSQWTNFFWPNRYGHPLTGNFNPGRGSVIYQNYWETACYIGIVPCLLLAASPLALIRRRRTFRYALFWMAVLALSIWLALGKTAWLYRIAFYVVPGVRAFHDPARFLMTASFAAALLAAMVMDRLMFRPKKRQALALVFAFVTIVLTIVDLGRFDRAIYPLKPIAEIRGAISRSVLATALLHDPVLAQRNGRVMMVDSERPWSYFTSYKSFRDKEDGFLARWVDTGVPNLLMSSGILEAGAYEPLAPAVPQRRAYIVQHSPIFPSKIAGSMAVEQVIAFRPHPLAIQPSLVRLKAFHTADNVDNIYYYRNLDYQPRVRFVDARNGEVADPKVTGTPIIIEERPDILNVEIPPSLVARTLVVADNCYPGWRALLDSEQTPILETSDGFRKVRVPATMDTTTLSFVYRPMVFLLGLFVTLTTLFMLMMRIGTTLARSSFKARSGSGRPSGEGGWLFPSVPIPGQDDGDAAPDSPGDDDPGPGTHGADDGGLIEWRPGSGTLSDSGSHMS